MSQIYSETSLSEMLCFASNMAVDGKVSQTEICQQLWIAVKLPQVTSNVMHHFGAK